MSEYNDIKQAYQSKKPLTEIHPLYHQIEDKNATNDHEYGNSFIHLAATFADYEAIQLLLDAGASASVANRYDYTPLHLLAAPGNMYYIRTDEAIEKTTRLLLDVRVSTLKKNEEELTCYHLAAREGNYPMIKALIDAGVKMGLSGKDGVTALHLACEYVKHRTLGDDKEKVAEDYFQIIKSLVEYGLDPDAKTNYGYPPLYFAVESNAKKIAAFLKGDYSYLQ